MQIFYGRYSYHTMKQGLLEGIFWRISAYLIGSLWTVVLMLFIPEQKKAERYESLHTLRLFHIQFYSQRSVMIASTVCMEDDTHFSR